jgi:hypothetical protein
VRVINNQQRNKISTSFSSAVEYKIGKSTSPGDAALKLDGYMDDFRIYNLPLTVAQVQELYQGRVTIYNNVPQGSVTVGQDTNNSAYIANTNTNGSIRLAVNRLDRMVITSNGNVGIGTADPANSLSVNGNVNITGALTAANINISSNNINRMVITSNGNIGIGTINPQSIIHFHNSSIISNIQIQFTDATTGVNSNNGFAIGLDTTDNGYVTNYGNKSIIFGTNNATRMTLGGDGNLTLAGNISKVGTLDISGSGASGVITLGTNGTTRMTFASDGAVDLARNTTNKVVTISSDSTATSFTSLVVKGSGSFTGPVAAGASDIRLKNVLSNINNSLEIINNLNGFYYNFNDIANNYGFNKDKIEIGLNAQEVQRFLPEIVQLSPFDTIYDNSGNLTSRSGSNYLTLSYDKLVPVLVEGMKELNNKNKELNDELSNIKYRLNM